MRPIVRALWTIMAVALCATHAVDARTHHRAPKRTAPAASAATVVTPSGTARDPADVALDRKIKGVNRHGSLRRSAR
jgi:hypothetical protein